MNQQVLQMAIGSLIGLTIAIAGDFFVSYEEVFPGFFQVQSCDPIGLSGNSYSTSSAYKSQASAETIVNIGDRYSEVKNAFYKRLGVWSGAGIIGGSFAVYSFYFFVRR